MLNQSKMENIDSKEQTLGELKLTIASSNDYIFKAIEHIEDLAISVQRGEIDISHFIMKTSATARKMASAHERLKLAKKIISLM